MQTDQWTQLQAIGSACCRRRTLCRRSHIRVVESDIRKDEEGSCSIVYWIVSLGSLQSQYLAFVLWVLSCFVVQIGEILWKGHHPIRPFVVTSARKSVTARIGLKLNSNEHPISIARSFQRCVVCMR